MTVEAIAEVVADIRAGRVHHPAAFDRAGTETSRALLARAQLPQPVVDCTAIFHQQRQAEEVDLYDDHPQVMPPWTDAMLCYVNTHGNVLVMQVHRNDHDGSAPSKTVWATDNEVEWARVRWIANTAIWVGGRSGDGKSLPTSGPCHLFAHAIHVDGTPADIHWVALLDRAAHSLTSGDLVSSAGDPTWEAVLVTLGASLNFLNASNVDVAEPARPRAQRRRLERTGVQVQTIVVRPPGKYRSKAAAARPIDAMESVFSPVRGHFARCGEQYGRGKLFGKYDGKFWIPAHARGSNEDRPTDYVLRPGNNAA